MNANKQPKIKYFLNTLNEKEKFVRIYTKLNLPFSKTKKIFCDKMLDLLKILKNIPDKNRRTARGKRKVFYYKFNEM